MCGLKLYSLVWVFKTLKVFLSNFLFSIFSLPSCVLRETSWLLSTVRCTHTVTTHRIFKQASCPSHEHLNLIEWPCAGELRSTRLGSTSVMFTLRRSNCRPIPFHRVPIPRCKYPPVLGSHLGGQEAHVKPPYLTQTTGTWFGGRNHSFPSLINPIHLCFTECLRG
jgi:hypothetical protein